MEIYDAKKDEQFNSSRAYIDADEWKVRKLDDGRQIPYRYLHGGFEDTGVKFSFCYPIREMYEGRFYQYLSPFPGPDEELASLPVTGIDDKIAFCITHGAYYVETNMGSAAAFTSHEDSTMTYRSSAAAAEYSRVKAREIYGYEHRPYGYVYGGSGGGYRTIGCIENTNAFDGAAPYVIGCPYAIPNCQTTRAHAERILRNKIGQIIDAVDAGGSGDPYAGLNEEEAAALKEVTLFGYPLKSWFASADLNDGALPVLAPGVKNMDPGYFTDFWTKPGYLGTEPGSSARRERICYDTKIRMLYDPDRKGKESEQEGGIDTRNGVNDAWKKMIGIAGSEDVKPWMALDETPEGEDIYVKGAQITVLSGKAQGRTLQIEKIEDGRVYVTDGFGMAPAQETLSLLEEADQVHLDNSDYLAIQTYHRHQVPSPDYRAWDQFRDEEGKPLYPQRDMLVGPAFSNSGTGCQQTGRIQSKIIISAALMDEQAYPWQADWYRRKVASLCEGSAEECCRLYYYDNVLHDDITDTIDELHVTSYIAGLKQSLIDLAAWVEKGIEPLPSTNYSVNVGHVTVPDTAAERGGLQPVPTLLANGAKCAHVRAGEPVQFAVSADVPDGAGSLTCVEWSFEGEQDFPVKGEWSLTENGKHGTAAASHTYAEPGTYFAVVRVKSERNGDKGAPFTQIRNIDRARVIVEPM